MGFLQQHKKKEFSTMWSFINFKHQLQYYMAGGQKSEAIRTK